MPLDKNATIHTQSRYDFQAPLYNLMEFFPEILFYRRWRKSLWAQVKGNEVLEIGVGTGKNIPYYPANASVIGIDLSKNMLAGARRSLTGQTRKQVTLQEMDAQQMTFSDEQFDHVAATFVFCSVPDPVLGLQEALRVTKPGGKLTLLEHTLADTPWLAWVMKKIDGAAHWLFGFHIARPTVEHVKAAGWQVEQVENLSLFNVFRRITAHKA